MQKIVIEVKDNYAGNILEMLNSLKGIMIDQIQYDEKHHEETELDFMKLQINSMKDTWDNQGDEAWDEV